MNSKLVAVGVTAFGYGALVAWAFTADHIEGKMKRNQLILSQMLSRKEKQIVDLEERLLDRVPWTSPTDEAVQQAASKVTGDILSDDNVLTTFDDEGGVVMTTEIDDPRGTVVGTVEKIAETTEDELPVDEVAIRHHRRDLRSLIDQYTADPDDQDAFVAKATNMLEHAQDTPPFHIPMGLYASDPEEGDTYSKITLKYFPRDRILLDDAEEPIDDVEHYVGWRNLNRFGDESGDPDTVFVRNRRLLTDFEVIREEDEDPPLHVRYGMDRETFVLNVAAGIVKMPREVDSD